MPDLLVCRAQGVQQSRSSWWRPSTRPGSAPFPNPQDRGFTLDCGSIAVGPSAAGSRPDHQLGNSVRHPPAEHVDVFVRCELEDDSLAEVDDILRWFRCIRLT